MTFEEFQRIHSRRLFLRNCAGGLGTIALANLLSGSARAAAKRTDPLAPKAPHFAPKAKNVIFLFMEGAPSQMDLFDPKPELQKWQGKPLPPSMTKQLQAGVHQAHRRGAGQPARVQALRPVRHRVFGFHPAHRLLRRRHLPDPLHVHRCVQSSSRPVAADERHHAVRPADDGRVGDYTDWAANPRICRDSWC